MSDSFPNAISTRALQNILHQRSNTQQRLQSQQQPAVVTKTLPKHPTWVSIVVRAEERLTVSDYNRLKQSLLAFVSPLSIGPAHAMRSRDGQQLQMMAKIKPGDYRSVEAFALSLDDPDIGLEVQVQPTDG